MSSLHKQNFDLKLELYHRRQRQTALEERLEAAEAQIAQQAEVQDVNEQLLEELEKRDQAVEEAVAIICTLEERVERLMEERSAVRSFDSQYERSYFHGDPNEIGTSSLDPDSSPPQLHGKIQVEQTRRPGLITRAVARMPSFLSEQSEGAEALRSLYLPNNHRSLSVLSLPKLLEDSGNNGYAEPDGMNSPRLSVLSESSFRSVYGEKTLALESLDLDESILAGSPNGRRHRKSLSVERWIEDRLSKTTPQKLSANPSGVLRKSQFLSINDVLESPLQRLEKLEQTLSKHNTNMRSASLLRGSVAVEHRDAVGTHVNDAKQGTMRRTQVETHEDQQTLPPTPDTFSTSTLRIYKNSYDARDNNVSGRDHELDRPYRDRSRTSAAYSSSSAIRPHSAGETITSRREGHGWDTVTQSEVTSAESDIDVEAVSTSDPWIAMGRKKFRLPIQPPDMFTFGAEDDEWGQDMMFNRETPLALSSRHQFRDRMEPNSDDTVIPSTRRGVSSSDYDRNGQSSFRSKPFDASPHPDPPQRKSSLAASPAGNGKYEKKSRKPSPSSAHPAVAPINQGISRDTDVRDKDKDSKRSRLTSKLFSIGRADHLSNLSPSGPVDYNRGRSNDDYFKEPGGHRAQRRSVDLGMEGLHGASATPPPISRYPRGRETSSGNGGDRVDLRRPTTASSLESRLPIAATKIARRERKDDLAGVNGGGRRRRGSETFGLSIDGASDDKEVPSGAGGWNGKSGRKWFTLGRSGSLRR